MTRNPKDKTPVQAKADAGVAKKKKAGPLQFLGQVRQEARKVTWTGRQELIVSTILVLILATIAMLFFWAVDATLNFTITRLLALGT